MKAIVDLNLVNEKASTAGVTFQNSPYSYFKGTTWNGSASEAMSARLALKPTNQNKVKFSIEGNHSIGGWVDMLSVESQYSSTNSAVLYLQGLFTGYGGKIEVDYDGYFRFKDLSGNFSHFGALSFGGSGNPAFNEFWSNAYDADIRTNFGGRILISAGVPPWKYGGTEGTTTGWTGAEYVLSYLPIAIGVGGSPTAKFQVRSTTEQARFEYDASNRFKITVASSADTTFDLTAGSGTPKFIFSKDIEVSKITSTTIELGHASDTTLSRSSAGILAIEGTILPSVSSTNSLTNKFITPQTQTVADAGGTLTPVAILNDMVIATALSQATLIANPSGSPVQGEKLIIRLKDNGTSRALSYGSQYREIGNSLPTATAANKTMYLGFIFNSTDTKWDLIAVSEEV